MTRKIPWIISVICMVVAAVAVTKLLARSEARQSGSDGADSAKIEARLARIEQEMPRAKALAKVGAQLGAAALAGDRAPTATAPDEGTPEAEAREKEQEADRAEQEARHYDQLDALARGGGGDALSAHVRKNLEQLKAAAGKAAPLDVAGVACSEALCRVEIRPGPRAVPGPATLHFLQRGMGSLSMRPSAPGKPAVYYVAAPGQRLPRLDL